LRSVAPVENSLSIAKAPALAIEDSFDPGASLAERPDVELEGQASKKGGVIRVGESESPIESKTESSRQGSRRDVPVATSIPHEYLEGIREWLDSPPIEIEEGPRRKTLPPSPESAFAPVKDRGQSTRPSLAIRKHRRKTKSRNSVCRLAASALWLKSRRRQNTAEPCAAADAAAGQPRTAGARCLCLE
jgi:hypothetical protein